MVLEAEDFPYEVLVAADTVAGARDGFHDDAGGGAVRVVHGDCEVAAGDAEDRFDVVAGAGEEVGDATHFDVVFSCDCGGCRCG